MKKGKTLNQTIDVMVKILIAFVLVFLLYLISKFINNFSYDYFVFPLLSMIIIFVCGINVGRALERMKENKKIGFFTKDDKSEPTGTKTEFYVKERTEIITSKKILKDLEDGEKVHIKTFNYEELDVQNNEKEVEE